MRLAVNGQTPVEFYGRMGGIVPFPEEVVERLAETAHQFIVPEMNRGQIALEVERIVGRRKVQRVNRVDGEMVTPQMMLYAMEDR